MIRGAGIDVVVFIMLGGPSDDLDSFKRVLDYCDRLNVVAHPVMIVPYPGTEIRRVWAPKLLYKDDWNMYDGLHMMVRQEGVSPEDSNRALMELWTELFSYPRIVRRTFGVSLKGFPSAHLASAIFQLAIKSAFKQYIKEYRQQYFSLKERPSSR